MRAVSTGPLGEGRLLPERGRGQVQRDAAGHAERLYDQQGPQGQVQRSVGPSRACITSQVTHFGGPHTSLLVNE